MTVDFKICKRCTNSFLKRYVKDASGMCGMCEVEHEQEQEKKAMIALGLPVKLNSRGQV